MLELKSAYEILGLKENASREELEKRFEFLIRKGKADSISEDIDKDSHNLKMDEISKAYNRIISNELDIKEKEEEKRNPRKPNPIFKLVGVDEKKARNYIYYHKFHYIFGIIGVIILVYLIKTIVFQVNPEVNMAFMGQIYYNDTSVIADKIKSTYPDIKGVGFDGAMLTGDSKNPQESAMLQKAMVLFAAGNIDIYVLDKENFEKYASLGAFTSLDELVTKLELEKNRYQDYSLTPKEEQKEHIYGINVTNSSILKQSKVSGKDMIAAIRIKTKHFDKAVEILKVLLK